MAAFEYPWQVPQLELADSALWMWHMHVCIADPLPHPIIDDMWKVGTYDWYRSHIIGHPLREYRCVIEGR